MHVSWDGATEPGLYVLSEMQGTFSTSSKATIDLFVLMDVLVCEPVGIRGPCIQRGGPQLPRIWATGGSEQPCGGWEPNSDPCKSTKSA